MTTPDATERPPRRAQNLAVSAGLVAATAAAGTLASEPDGSWYRTLDKPSWQPPASAFPVVWTSLYTGIAATSAALLNELDRRGDEEEAAAYRKALAGNLALNGSWSWLFFRAHNLPAATVGAGVLALSSIGLARRAARVDRRFGLALAPYALWTSFATVLAGVLWQRNPPRD
ncbi:MAG: TspO/MBR family protein [Propionicimonas sp.]